VHKQQPPLLLEPSPSKRLKQAVIATHLLAATASVSNALPIAIKIALLAACAGHLYFSINRLKNTSLAIKHSDAFGWEVSTNEEEFASVQILNSTVITTFIVIIHYQTQTMLGLTPKRIQTLLIVNDTLAKNDFRNLMVRLKIETVKD